MARRRYRSGRSFRRYASRGYGFARRAYGKSGLNLSMPFLAGAALGAFTDIDNNIPTEIKILGATAPVRGFGMVKGFAQGMLFGDVLYKYIKGGIGSNGAPAGGAI